MFIKNQICKEKREIFRTISERRSFNEWNDFKALEFRRYNETERLILYFRVHLGILNRKEISKRTGIPEYKITKFVKAIRTWVTDPRVKDPYEYGKYPKTDSYYRVGGTD